MHNYSNIFYALWCILQTELLDLQAWKQYRTFRTQQLWQNINQLLLNAIYSHHIDVENIVINSDSINKVYRYANRKFTIKSQIGPLKFNDGSILIDPTKQGWVAANLFYILFTTDNLSNCFNSTCY